MIEAFLQIPLALEAAVITGSGLLVSMAIYWRGKSHNSTEKEAGDAFGMKLNSMAVDNEQLRGDVIKYLQQTDGKSDAQRQLATKRDALLTKHANGMKETKDLKATPWAELEETRASLDAIGAHKEEALIRSDEIKGHADRIEGVAARLRLSDRINEHGQVVDAAGLAPHDIAEIETLLAGYSRVVNSEFMKEQSQIQQGFDADVTDFRRRYAELEPHQDIVPKPLDAVPGVDTAAGAQASTDEVTTVQQSGNAVTSGKSNAGMSAVPVSQAVQRPPDITTTTVRISQGEGSSKKQGPSQK
ncbi:hypothetical protein J4H86_06675 [Spiractinospora alimapuensis]|uniref:hypothetical protein n=1 Tax=Spiractinospora alimapuensis TaxID=2820884 RepID=UPI001F2D1B0B|nr:hypothetical protein [Spiractinospora alimapuensis]QVQ53437.1 hypothetical protein J4H86_06675 [Spiractinospora alimapuensis]